MRRLTRSTEHQQLNAKLWEEIDPYWSRMAPFSDRVMKTVSLGCVKWCLTRSTRKKNLIYISEHAISHECVSVCAYQKLCLFSN